MDDGVLMIILGINVVFYDSVVVIVVDGIVVVVVEEECFLCIKYGKCLVFFLVWELLFNVIDYCFVEVGIMLVEVDYVVYSFDLQCFFGIMVLVFEFVVLLFKLLKVGSGWESLWDVLFVIYIMNVLYQFIDGVLYYLCWCFEGGGNVFFYCWYFINYYFCYQVSVFFVVFFVSCVVMMFDGCGEWVIIFYGVYCNNCYFLFGYVMVLDLLGIFYEWIIGYLGFFYFSDEYKVMVLVVLGVFSYCKVFVEVVQIGSEGVFMVVSIDLEVVFGLLWKFGLLFEQCYFDLVVLLQEVFENIVFQLVCWLCE